MPIQDHIHIGFALSSSPEEAPIYKYKASDMTPVFEGSFEFQRSNTGKAHLHVLATDSGIPVIYEDFQYELKLYGDGIKTGYDQYKELVRMQYQNLYFIPHEHTDDGTDHASDIRVSVITEVQFTEWLDPYLQYVSARIYVKDASEKGYMTSTTLSSVEEIEFNGGGIVNLNDLGNVNAPTPSNNQVLGWDSGTEKWIAITVNASGSNQLSSLLDVILSTPSNNDILQFNGSNWVNKTFSGAGIASSSHTHDASVLTFTPSTLSNWNSNADPGEIQDALDQLVARLKTVETGGAPTATALTYTVGASADWSNGPGTPINAQQGLDYLADRVTDIEAVSSAPDAVSVTYTPTTPANFDSAQSVVQGALDELASRMVIAEGTSGAQYTEVLHPDVPASPVNGTADEFIQSSYQPIGNYYDASEDPANFLTTVVTTGNISPFTNLVRLSTFSYLEAYMEEVPYGIRMRAYNQNTSNDKYYGLYQSKTNISDGSEIQIVAKMSVDPVYGSESTGGLVIGKDLDFENVQDWNFLFGCRIRYNSNSQTYFGNIVLWRVYGETFTESIASISCDPFNTPKYWKITYSAVDSSGYTGTARFWFSYDGISWNNILAMSPIGNFTSSAHSVLIPSGSTFSKNDGARLSMINMSNKLDFGAGVWLERAPTVASEPLQSSQATLHWWRDSYKGATGNVHENLTDNRQRIIEP